MKNTITVLTPTYNRKHTLGNLYESLLKQTSSNFEWIIIDDGSTDDSKDLIDHLISRNNPFKIRYYYKENGGKHTALNVGIQIIESELTFIVDSDDMLTPCAIQIIEEEWKKVKDDNLCGISFLRGYSSTKVIGQKHGNDYFVDTFINVRINHGIEGDKAEVWKTEILKEFLFPEIEGEEFFGEGYAWVRMAKHYKMLFINKIIYITEYLDGGLTKSGRKLRVQCPVGGMINAKELLSKEFLSKIRIKHSWLYISYGFFAKKSFGYMLKDSGHPLLILLNLPFGYLLYRFWKYKYLD